ncbi:MAG: hypothetical protein ACQKBT_05400 [Puniceicoccales bacterium]
MITKTPNAFILLSVSLFATMSPALGDPLVSYMTGHISTGDSIAANFTDAEVTAGNLTEHLDPGSSSYATFNASSDNFYSRLNLIPETADYSGFENGQGGTNYMDFTMEADEGEALYLDSISWTMGSTSAQTYPFTINTAIRSSLDNFSSNLNHETFTNSVVASTISMDSYTLDLSDVEAMQSITGEVTFRIYFWGASDPVNRGSSTFFYFDNLVISGSVAEAIPEPSAGAAILGISVLLWGCRRKLNRRIR